MIEISKNNFNRKLYLKNTKNKIKLYLIKCKLYKAGNLKQAETNYNQIIEILNKSLQTESTYLNNNIFVILNKIEEHFQFLKDFSESIKTTENTEALKDRHIMFFKYQNELLIFLNENFFNPKLPELI